MDIFLLNKSTFMVILEIKFWLESLYVLRGLIREKYIYSIQGASAQLAMVKLPKCCWSSRPLEVSMANEPVPTGLSA